MLLVAGTWPVVRNVSAAARRGGTADGPLLESALAVGAIVGKSTCAFGSEPAARPLGGVEQLPDAARQPIGERCRSRRGSRLAGCRRTRRASAAATLLRSFA